MSRILVLIPLLAACGGATPRVRSPDVKVWGALHAIMAEGKVGATVALADVPGPHVYALGALSELRGEVLVLDDRRMASYPAGDAVRIDEGAGAEKATLLVAANVPGWIGIPIPEDIAAADLDARIAALAGAAGMDLTKPFPFLVEGRFREVSWHVMDGERLPATATHDERMSAARKGTMDAAEGTALGFYSTTSTGVYTHMGRSTHVHGLFPAAGVMGHCDQIGIVAGSVLSLPAR